MVVGIDSHKETVAACAVDELGGELAVAIFPNTGAGHDSLLMWARSRGKVSLFGIEGSGGVGNALARRLATLGEGVVEVPPFLTVRERKHLRQRGKSDPADALAIARVVAREADLPRFLIHDRARQLGQILNYRDQLVEERTRGANRLHSELTRRHPGYQAEIRNLVSRRSLRRVQALIEADASIETALLLRRLTSLRRLSSEIADLNVHINRLVEQSRTGLIEITGVGPLVAARILAEVGDVQRIASESRFAALNGTAPVPASSGATQRHRLNRGGNRRLNRALHTIAVIQAHLEPRARAYLLRRRAEGKTQREASAVSSDNSQMLSTDSWSRIAINFGNCFQPTCQPVYKAAALPIELRRHPLRRLAQGTSAGFRAGRLRLARRDENNDSAQLFGSSRPRRGLEPADRRASYQQQSLRH